MLNTEQIPRRTGARAPKRARRHPHARGFWAFAIACIVLGGSWVPTANAADGGSAEQAASISKPKESAHKGAAPKKTDDWKSRAPTLRKRLAGILKERLTKFPKGAELQIAVRDLKTGEVLYRTKSEKSLNLASVTKMVSAGAALHFLGPAFTFQTRLMAAGRSGDSVNSVFLRTGGDPMLTEADLAALALAVRRQGIRKTKRVEILLSPPGAAQFPPEFETKKTDSAYRAPVGGFNLNHNRIMIHIKPSDILGKAPRISLSPSAAAIKIVNRAKTITGKADKIGVRVDWANNDLPTITVTGSIGAKRGSGVTGVRLNKHPERWAAETFRTLLSRSGVKVPANAKIVKSAPKNAYRITKYESAPLSEILRHTLQHSDNQAAETVLMHLGGTVFGSAAPAIKRVQSWLNAIGISKDNLIILNGSGLYGGSAGSALAVTQMLVKIYQNRAIGPDFLAALAVPGRPGTMAQRLKHLPAGSIRAKTGTLNEVSSLCGFALGRERKTAFCVLANGIKKGNLGAARELQDRVAEALVQP